MIRAEDEKHKGAGSQAAAKAFEAQKKYYYS
jgi:hypothetical protein